MLTYRWIAAAAFAMFMIKGLPSAHASDDEIKTAYADVNGVRLHYAKAGSGKLILFLHGFPEFWVQWKAQLQEFGKDYMAVAPDMRGINLSSKPREVDQYKVKTLVEDVRALADHLGQKKFTLVGHDWGGIVAWTFAMYYPDRLDKLVILNAPHPALFERESRENPAQIQASQYMLLFNTPEAEKVLTENDFAGLVHHVLSDGLSKGYASEEDKAAYLSVWNDGASLTGGLNYYRASRLSPAPKPGDHWLVSKHFAPDLPTLNVHVPTLVLWGMDDIYLLAGQLSGLSRYVPNMTVKLFPETPHWLNRAKANEVNSAMREFLSTPFAQ
jgi:epoxide hydrolase 4